jgi:conjugative relaxase-like TrwC/TraI family protein
MPGQITTKQRRNRVFKSLHKPLTYLGVDTILGEWQGRMAKRYGLAGAINEAQFARLSDGQNPLTGEQLVRHRNGQEYTTADGTTVKPVEHRAGWDATFSAPKSVSLTALVGGDDRVREAHRQAVTRGPRG